MRKKKQTPLSNFLIEETHLRQQQLKLERKSITIIDKISPFVCSELLTLNLSYNRLSSLKNIHQFQFLLSLDISYNRITRCQELEELKQLQQLKKLYIQGNPFLSQPLEEKILQIILEKQTDIEVLSFEVLSTIRQVQEEEIKVIFLSNYLNKINLHEELKGRELLPNASEDRLSTQGLINKIIPQFYTVIEDPKIANKIKKQAIAIKRKQHGTTIQEAIQQTRNNRQQQIDQLVKNIVTVLRDNQRFAQNETYILEVNMNENTISFSPQRDRFHNNSHNSQRITESPIREKFLQFSPVRQIEQSKDLQSSLEEITLTNTKHFAVGIKNFEVHPIRIEDGAGKIGPNLDSVDTNRKPSNKSILQRFRKFTQGRSNNEERRMNSLLKQDQRKEARSKGKEVKELTPSGNFKLQTKIQPRQIRYTEQKEGNKKNLFMKIIDEHEVEEVPQIKSRVEKFSSRSCAISPKSSSIEQYGTFKSTENIQSLYFKTLSKTNPMFHLLYSPAHSLNNQEKNTILQALKVDHKQKFFELAKQRHYAQSLLRELENLHQQSSQKIDELQNGNKQMLKENIRLRQEWDWINNKSKSVESELIKASSRLKELESSNKSKASAMSIMEGSFKKIKDTYLQKCDDVKLLNSYEDLEQTIMEKRLKTIKRRYFGLLHKSASRWVKIIKKIKQKQIERRRNLYLMSFRNFQDNRMRQKNMKRNLNTKNRKLMQQYFNQWVFQHIAIKKQILLIKILLRNKKIKMMKQLKQNEAKRKVIKLRNIWADRHFNSTQSFKLIKKFKELKQSMRKKVQKATSHFAKNYLMRYYKAIQGLIISKNYKTQKIRQTYLKKMVILQKARMINILKTQHLDLVNKTLCVKQNHEKIVRIQNFIRLKQKTDDRKLRKHKFKNLALFLKKKYVSSFRICYKKKRLILARLNSLNRSLKNQLHTKFLTIEKKSYDFEFRLHHTNIEYFFTNLKEIYQIKLIDRQKYSQIQTFMSGKLHFKKLRFIKRLQIARLKGRNFVKNRTIQEMNVQMGLTELHAVDLLQETRDDLSRRQRQIFFLRQQIQNQSLREAVLLEEKDEILGSCGESLKVLEEMRMAFGKLNQDYMNQQIKYQELVKLYNENLSLFHRKSKDFEWLRDSIRDRPSII